MTGTTTIHRRQQGKCLGAAQLARGRRAVNLAIFRRVDYTERNDKYTGTTTRSAVSLARTFYLL
jgi:hypothetical protein